MSYRHILVAVNFAKGTREIVERAVGLAKPLGAKLSLIHLNNEITDEAEFGGLIDTDLAEIEPAHPTVADLTNKLDALAAEFDYPIENKFIVRGDLNHGLEEPIRETEVDLIVCGHHHNFWSRLKPASRNLLNTSPVDLLIVPLKD